jgi:hypothetical protein
LMVKTFGKNYRKHRNNIPDNAGALEWHWSGSPKLQIE